nr:MAG TPA: hypothetical protein [Caudoviricetes sp.]
MRHPLPLDDLPQRALHRRPRRPLQQVSRDRARWRLPLRPPGRRDRALLQGAARLGKPEPDGGLRLDRHSRSDVAGRGARRADLRSGRRLAPSEGRFMRRIARTQQRKRQTWLALPASGIEEVGHGQD